ncbi:hypothetical protein Tco_0185451 [Tanacetum coccineum]
MYNLGVIKIQPQQGEGSVIPTDPYYIPTILHPSTSQPQKTQTPMELTRMDTKIPQSSGPTEHVADEAVYKGGVTVWCQETMGDTIAQTRFENVSKLSNDSVLARVLDLEKTKTTQANEIASFKRRVKTLKKKRSSRTHKLKWLYKGRINAIDADEDITLVSVHDMNVSVDEEVSEEEVVEVVNTAKLIIDAAQVNSAGDKVSTVGAATTVSATTTTANDLTLAQALQEMKSTKPKQKGGKSQSQDKEKGILVEEPVKPAKKKDQIRLDEEAALRLQADFNEEERLARDSAQKEQEEANIALTEEWDDIQAKIEADHKLAQRLQAEKQEELTIEEKANLFKQLLEQRRKKLKDLKNKSFDSIQKMFDRTFKRVNTFVDFRINLVEGSSKRAGEELEQESTKKQKVDEDKDIAVLQSLMKVIPNEEEVVIDVVPLATKPLTIVD